MNKHNTKRVHEEEQKGLKFILKVSVFSTYLKLQHYDLSNNYFQGLSRFFKKNFVQDTVSK